MLSVSLLERLAEHPHGLPLIELAARLRATVDAVRDAADALRAEGNRISEDNETLRLHDPRGMGPATLSWRCRRPVEWHDSCMSTNTLARAHASALRFGLPTHRLPVVAARHQTHGKGRLGRQWSADSGENLLFSVVLRPPLPLAETPRAVLAWAAAMAEVLDCGLKWPNDLVVRKNNHLYKLGGILAELDVIADGNYSVVLGVGINVRQTHFPDLPDATSLAREGRHVDDLAALMGALVQAIDETNVEGDHWRSRWRRRAVMLGDRVRVGAIEGIAEDIREDGALLVDGQPILAGDVSLVSGGSLAPPIG